MTEMSRSAHEFQVDTSSPQPGLWERIQDACYEGWLAGQARQIKSGVNELDHTECFLRLWWRL